MNDPLNPTATTRLNSWQLSALIEALETEIDAGRETLKQMDESDPDRADLNEHIMDLSALKAQLVGALDTIR